MILLVSSLFLKYVGGYYTPAISLEKDSLTCMLKRVFTEVPVWFFCYIIILLLLYY